MGDDVVYICRVVDESHPALGNQVRWIRALASRPRVRSVRVLTRRHGPAELPENVSVHTFEGGTIGSLWPFYREVARAVGDGVDYFFVSQGGPYPAMLLPVKVLTRRPVYHWKAMSYISPRMRFYARYCDDLVFTSTESSFPLDLPKRRIVGQGIDTELFHPADDVAPAGDLIAVGRVAPGKHLDQMVRVLAACRARHDLTLSLDVIGPCAKRNEVYRDEVLTEAASLGVADQVRFLGSRPQVELPGLLPAYRVNLNFATTAFDKTAGEAMACGLPVIATNEPVREVLPPHLRDDLYADPGDTDAQADAVARVLRWDDATRRKVASELRQTIVEGHSLHTFFDKMLDEIEEHRGRRRRLRRRPPRDLPAE